MRPEEKLQYESKINASIEAYGDARYREGVKAGLDVAEFAIVVWSTGKGTTKKNLIKWVQDKIDSVKRSTGI